MEKNSPLESSQGPQDNDGKYTEFVASNRKAASRHSESLLEYSRDGKRSKERDLEGTVETMDNLKKEMGELRAEIDEMKSSLIVRILERKKINELRSKLGRSEGYLADREELAAWLGEVVSYYDRIIIEEEQMGILMEEAQVMNEEFDEKKRNEFLEDEKNRSIQELVKKHDVFFVHDIVTADWKPSDNNRAIDTKELDFEDQLNIVLGLDPSLSVSTLSPDSKNRTFGMESWGVLFSGGRVAGGHAGDAATRAYGLRDRRMDESLQTLESIERSIERTGGGGKINDASYNELVLEKPEVGGIYFKLGGEKYPKLEEGKKVILQNNKIEGFGSWDEWWNRIEKSMKTGTPIFVIEENNNARMVYDINLKERSFMVTPRYSPEDLVDMPGVYKQHTDESSKKAAITRVFHKVAHIMPENERLSYEQNTDKGSSENFYNIH